MDIKSIKKEITEHFMLSNGLVTVERDGDAHSVGMGNGLMHTGLYYAVLSEKLAFDVADAAMFSITVKACYVPGHDGLLNRAPWKKDPETHDDYILVLGGGYLARCKVLVKTVVDTLEQRKWYANNVNPYSKDPVDYLNGWFDRFPGLVTFFKTCSRICNPVTISVWEQLVLAAQLAVSAFNKKSDGHIQSSVKLWVCRKEYPIVFVPVWWFWSKIIRKRYGSVPKSWEGYLGVGHPLTLVEDDF